MQLRFWRTKSFPDCFFKSQSALGASLHSQFIPFSWLFLPFVATWPQDSDRTRFLIGQDIGQYMTVPLLCSIWIPSKVTQSRATAEVAELQFMFSKLKMLNELPWSVRCRAPASKMMCETLIDVDFHIVLRMIPFRMPILRSNQVTLNNTIIRNLGGVAKAIDQFEKGIAAFNGSLINTLQVMKNNMYFANWMGLVMLAAPGA